MSKMLNPRAEEWKPHPTTTLQIAIQPQPQSQFLIAQQPFTAAVAPPPEMIFSMHYSCYNQMSVISYHQAAGFTPYPSMPPIPMPMPMPMPMLLIQEIEKLEDEKTVPHVTTTAMLSNNQHKKKKKMNKNRKLEGGGGGRKSCPPRLRRRAGVPKTATTVMRKTQEVMDQEDLANTTVMIRNIPNQLRSHYMLRFMDKLCKFHSLEYDFLYLPIDFVKKFNLGYAFVNMTSTVDALKLKTVLHGYKWGTIVTFKGFVTSKKICETTWARIQGKENLMKKFKQTNFHCDKMEFLPLLLDPPRNGLNPNPSPPITVGKLRGGHHG